MKKTSLFAVGGIIYLLAIACTFRFGWPSGLEDDPAPTAQPLPATSQPVGETSARPPEGGPQEIRPPEEHIQLPQGFAISIFTAELTSPRMLAVGPDDLLYAADRGAGEIVRLPDRNGDGLADQKEVVARDLDAPSSLAFYQDGSLYVAETRRVLRLSDPDDQGVFQAREVIIDGLPSGGHSTRTVLFSPDWSQLFVSIGSSCNVCEEADERRAAIMVYDPDGGNGRLFARGLRNAVGITFRPETDELWATNNGRDLLGDDLPPETVNLVREGDDFGWPRCHAGRMADPDFGGPEACEGVASPVVEMQAHSAPLGLEFYTGTQFPAEYQGDLFVAFHGSWNRTTPTGYKVVRIPLEAGGPGAVQDFAVGWLRDNGSSWGRPVDLVTGADGSLFVSDDAEGIIYRIFYNGG